MEEATDNEVNPKVKKKSKLFNYNRSSSRNN